MKQKTIFNGKNKIKKFVRRDAKASVFTHLFSIPRYMKELYVWLHPEDKDISEEDLKVYTISNILINTLINDMGILVRDTMIILAEAQSHWSINILPRTLEYLAETYNRYIYDTKQNVYGTKKVILPKPELYVVSTDSKKIKNKEISFQKEFFNGENCAVEVVVKVITLENASSVVKEYIRFTKIFDKNNKKYGYNKKSIITTVDYCIQHDILKDYLTEHQKEVYNIMTSLYNQKTATEMYGREQYAEGMQKGIEKGIEKGKISILIDMVKDKLLTATEAAKRIGMSKKEFSKLAGLY